MKALLLHVGADQTGFYTLGVNAPLFQGGGFEFIPITDFLTDGHYLENINDSITVKKKGGETISETLWTTETRTYSSVNARNQEYGVKLSDFLPEILDNVVMHYDPDFDHLTYGDRLDTSKGKQVGKLEPDDYLFFVSSLVQYSKETYKHRDYNRIRAYQRKKMAKYLIGKFKVQANFQTIKTFDSIIPLLYDNEDEDVTESIDKEMMTRILHNAHTKRGEDIYYLVVGNEQESTLMNKAIRLTEYGSPFKPSEYGKQIFGNVAFPRGYKWIYDEKKINNTLGLIEALSK